MGSVVFGESKGAGGLPQTTEISAISTITRSLSSYAALPGMSVTPPAGTYEVEFNTSASVDRNGRTGFLALFLNGVEIPGSERMVGGAAGDVSGVGCTATVAVSGGQVLEARWRVDTPALPPATLTVFTRSFKYTKVN